MHKLLSLCIYLCLFTSSSFGQQHDSTFYNEGVAHYENGEDEKAIPLLRIAASDSSNISIHKKGIANLWLMRMLSPAGETAEAITRGNKALEIFITEGDTAWYAETLYRLSMTNLAAGAYEKALVQSQEAFEKFTQLQDTSRMIWSLLRRGLVFHDIGEYREGIRVCNQAADIHEVYANNNADLKSIILGIKAINYDDMGQSDRAVEIYKIILALKDQLSDDREIIRTYNNMGNSLMKLGDLETAERYFKLALAGEERDDFKYGIATVTTNLGTISRKRGNFNEAHDLLDRAETISFEINDIEKILDILEQQHLLYEAEGDDTQALSYLKTYYQIKDSLYDLDKQRQIRLLEARFEAERKEQQIAVQEAQLGKKEAVIRTNRTLLTMSIIGLVLLVIIGLLWRNRLVKKQELKLKEAQLNAREAEIKASIASQEKERARYARDLHDGFGQLISVLNMNLRNLEKDITKDTRQQVFDESTHVIDNMYQELRNICFDMMPQVLIKHGLPAAVEALAARVNQTDQLLIETNCFGLNNRLDEVQEVSLYRICQEWVNNILKYSDAKKVNLQFTRDSDEITLMIEDDGMGFNNEILTEGKGNGWKNIQSRVNLVKGTLELETTSGIRGTALIINLPCYMRKHKNTVKTV